jgi:hypothetical protein
MENISVYYLCELININTIYLKEIKKEKGKRKKRKAQRSAAARRLARSMIEETRASAGMPGSLPQSMTGWQLWLVGWPHGPHAARCRCWIANR